MSVDGQHPTRNTFQGDTNSRYCFADSCRLERDGLCWICMPRPYIVYMCTAFTCSKFTKLFTSKLTTCIHENFDSWKCSTTRYHSELYKYCRLILCTEAAIWSCNVEPRLERVQKDRWTHKLYLQQTCDNQFHGSFTPYTFTVVQCCHYQKEKENMLMLRHECWSHSHIAGEVLSAS